ncbi:MAG TPA: aldo/keto reductase [Candidatus Nitrosocosmicus sp.]|nr:aldo/keto reductase [Candidatus Nitrosocosmicus sp.]
MKRKFGWTNVEIPVIGQGTWMIESGSRDDAEHLAIEALQLGLDLGLTHIDTAEMYGNGKVEELVGEAIAGRRDEVFLVSKVLPSHASFEGTLNACKQSLKRLKTDWLDLYLLHWPSSSIPLRDTMRAMEKLVAEGLVRFIGVSNFDLEELKEAEDSLRDERIACDQVLYHLRYRGIERRLLPYCTERGISVVGYAPFGHGNFPSPQSAGGRVLAEIAKLHGRTPRQVALNFLTRHPSIFTIPKNRLPERARENSGGVGWALTEDDVAAINQAFPVPEYDTSLEMI